MFIVRSWVNLVRGALKSATISPMTMPMEAAVVLTMLAVPMRYANSKHSPLDRPQRSVHLPAVRKAG